MELIMKIFLKSFIFILLIICFSCEDPTCYTCDENGWFLQCKECTQEEPLTATINIKVTNTEATVLIIVYEGELEDGLVYKSIETGSTEYSFTVPLNKKYTVTAEYQINGNTYIAVDTATPRVKYTEDQCEEPCYFVYDRKFDLRLKYTAD
jgi:hypothetical protein